MKKLREIWKRLFQKPEEETLQQIMQNEYISPFLITGGPGLGRQYCVIDGKEGIIIELSVFNIQEYYKDKDSIMLDDNVCPVDYRSYRIWAIRSTMFWYAIECDKKYYVFDVRKVVEQMQIPIEYNSDFDLKVCFHRHEWMVDFVEKMNETEYVIDVEGSINALQYH